MLAFCETKVASPHNPKFRKICSHVMVQRKPVLGSEGKGSLAR